MDKARQEVGGAGFFGARLRALRKARKLQGGRWPWEQIDRSYVGQIERGEADVSLVNIRPDTREVLGVSPRQLFPQDGFP